MSASKFFNAWRKCLLQKDSEALRAILSDDFVFSQHYFGLHTDLSSTVDFFETGQFKSIDEFQITLDTDDFIASVHTVTMNDGHVEKVYAFAKLRDGKAYEWHILPMPTLSLIHI